MSYITEETRQQIKELIPNNLRLVKNSNCHRGLQDFSNHKFGSNNYLVKRLRKSNLINQNNSLTVLGHAVLLASRLRIDLKSLFILICIWRTQKENNFSTTPTIFRLLPMIPHSTITRRIRNLKEDNMLYYANKNEILRIRDNVFLELVNHEECCTQLINYLDKLSSKYQQLQDNDPLIQSRKNKMEILWTR